MNNRNRTIDVLKGIAIISVLINHLGLKDYWRELFGYNYHVQLAVPVFMIITGFTYSLSFNNKKINSLHEAYTFNNIKGRLLRYTIPYIIVVIWIVFDKNLGFEFQGFYETLKWVLCGATGMGNYYYPLLLQLIFVFPLIYFLMSRYEKSYKGLIICLLINFAYELLKWAYGMNVEFYRLIVLRYIFVLAVGVYAYRGNKIKLIPSIIVTLIGGGFITAISYLGYKPVILSFWTTTCFVASMFVVPVMIWLLNNKKIKCYPLEIIGKASYHIFLVQMVYFLGYHGKVKGYISDIPLKYFLGIPICLIVGLAFYIFDKKVIQKVLAPIFK